MSNRIKDLRKSRGFTEEEIAEYLGIHQTTYGSYETGKLKIPMESCEKLADFYKTSLDYLLGRTSRIKPYKK